MKEESLIFNIIIWLFLIEIVVGIIQLIGALVRTIIKLNSNQPLGKLKTYWIIITGFLIIFATLYYSFIYFREKSFAYSYDRYYESMGYTFKAIIVWTSLAWLIAIWYCTNIVFTKKFISKIILIIKK